MQPAVGRAAARVQVRRREQSPLHASEWCAGSGRQTSQPLTQAMLDAYRAAGLEVMYTVIQSLTADGRDRGLDYKLSGFHVPPGSKDAQVGVPEPVHRRSSVCAHRGERLHVQSASGASRRPRLHFNRGPPAAAPLPLAQMLACVAPGPDEMVIPKSSSSVFQSTNIEYLLRNLGAKQLVLCGCVTGACCTVCVMLRAIDHLSVAGRMHASRPSTCARLPLPPCRRRLQTSAWSMLSGTRATEASW